MTKWLLTGGTGYLGVHLAAMLGARGVGRRTGYGLFNPALGNLLPQYEVVVHFAAQVAKSPDAAQMCFEVNSDGTRWLCAQLTDRHTLILASTKDVYGAHAEAYEVVPETCPTTLNGHNAYAWSKRMAEDYARFYAAQRGFRLFILRLSTVFAPPTPGNPGGLVSGFARAIRTGQPLRLRWRGKQIRDVLPVAELAKAIQACVDSPLTQGTFNIGGGPDYALTLAALAQRLGRIHGLTPVMELLDEPPSPDDQRRYVADLTHVGRELGWRPAFDLDAALAQA